MSIRVTYLSDDISDLLLNDIFDLRPGVIRRAGNTPSEAVNLFDVAVPPRSSLVNKGDRSWNIQKENKTLCSRTQRLD